LFLSPKVPPDRAASLRAAAAIRSGYVRIVDSEEGAIHVLPAFTYDEVAALEARKCRIIGLPFAERLVRDPSALERVPALPLYDFILPTQTTIITSGLSTEVRMRSIMLARWMGATTSEEIPLAVAHGNDSLGGILVAARVSLHSKSKYQAALARQIPIVRPAFLEATWAAKERANIEMYALPALQGLGVCIDHRYMDLKQEYEKRLSDHGAVMEKLDRAEIVIVKDTTAPLYADAKTIGLLCATPLWLDRCFQVRKCVPISGELDVPGTRSSSLVSIYASLESFGSSATFESECNTSLIGCVLCLCYLPEGRDRNYAKFLAWRCSAWTTLDPLYRAITHVLFKTVDKVTIPVSVPVDDDRVNFLDIAWLEKCVREGRHVSEQSQAAWQQKVHYNPVCDPMHTSIIGRVGNVAGKQSAAAQINGQNKQALEKHVTNHGPQPNLPIADAPQQLLSSAASKRKVAHFPASTDTGVFAGLKLGVLCGSSQADMEHERAVIERICGHGAVAVSGTCEALAEVGVDFCTSISPCIPPAVVVPPSMQIVTLSWLNACVADRVKHPPTQFPHFQPCRGVLPIPEMAACALRLTAVEGSGAAAAGQRKRAHLEELVTALGARVVDGTAGWRDITHMVCVVPELLDVKHLEASRKRKKPIVKVQWLFDSYKMGAWQPESRYEVRHIPSLPADSPAKTDSTMIRQRTFTVLDAYNVFISPSALGADDRLPGKAEELGAEVHTLRSAEELKSALAPYLQSGSSHNAVVLVEKEEVASANCPLVGCISEVPESLRSIFVLPSWLVETFAQRRVLPLDAFAALPPTEVVEQAKRQKTGEAMYAWQSAASVRLTELAEDSRAHALQCKQQQKVSEGLRLADLRREAPTASR
jgi:hypothetical protein